MTAIQLHCRKCERSMEYERSVDPSIPAAVTLIETDLCDECDNGDFGGETWFDANGNEVMPGWHRELIDREPDHGQYRKPR